MALERDSLSASYILGVDSIIIESQNRPNRIEITLKTILTNSFFIENPPTQEEIKIAKKDSHYNIELLWDHTGIQKKKNKLGSTEDGQSSTAIFQKIGRRKCYLFVLILDKAYLVPIMNTPDKTGESVAAKIHK